MPKICAKILYWNKEHRSFISIAIYMHQVNVAKKVIDIFKSNLISGLAMVDPNFLVHL